MLQLTFNPGLASTSFQTTLPKRPNFKEGVLKTVHAQKKVTGVLVRTPYMWACPQMFVATKMHQSLKTTDYLLSFFFAQITGLTGP